MTDLPRVGFEQLAPELAALLGAKYRRLGYLGEFFQVAAAQPDALAGFVRFTETLKAALPDDLTEVVALTVALETGNVYEQYQHERLALSYGLGEAWVRAVERRDPDRAGELDERQRSVQRLALVMVRDHGRNAAQLVSALGEHLAPDLVVAVLLVVCRYLGHASVVNALALTAPVGSPFGDRTDPHDVADPIANPAPTGPT